MNKQMTKENDYEIESLKIEGVLEDALNKVELLLKINKAEDNNSELAGYEINKLLQE